MNLAVQQLYRDYLKITGDKAAAANLVLADVMLSDCAPSSESLTVAEAARRLNTTRQTVYQMCQSGRLRCFRLGRSLRIPVEAIEECENTSGVREDVPPLFFKRHC